MCKLFQAFQACLAVSVVLHSQLSCLSREAGWLGGMQSLEKIGVQGLRE